MHQYSCWKHSSRWDSSLFFVHFRRSSDSLICKCVDCVQKSQSADHQCSFLAGRIDSDRVSQRIRCISMCAARFASRLRHSAPLLLLSAARKVWVYRISRTLAVIQRSTCVRLGVEWSERLFCNWSTQLSSSQLRFRADRSGRSVNLLSSSRRLTYRWPVSSAQPSPNPASHQHSTKPFFVIRSPAGILEFHNSVVCSEKRVLAFWTLFEFG